MNKRGVALIFGFIVVMVLTILGTAIFSRTIFEGNTVTRQIETSQAFWLAESAMNCAVSQLRADFFNVTSFSGCNATLGAGRRSADNPQNVTVGARVYKLVRGHGYVTAALPARVERIVESLVDGALFTNTTNATPPNFFGNAIYSAGIVVGNSAAAEITGNVVSGVNVTFSGDLDGNATIDPSIAPLAHLNFTQLRTISLAQGNYHNATITPAYPSVFWRNETAQIPNVVFVENDFAIAGNKVYGGFIVVAGENVTYDATVSGNCGINGSLYTLGTFTINGGGNKLNVNGGVWAGEQTVLNGAVELAYNATYMNALSEYLNTLNMTYNTNTCCNVTMFRWRDTQSF